VFQPTCDLRAQRYRIYTIKAVSASHVRAYDSAIAAAPRAAIPRKGLPMSSRKLDELATDIDDASLTVEELQYAPAADAHEKLDELHDTLEDASDTIDDLVDEDE
jgi:hypothetical protein